MHMYKQFITLAHIFNIMTKTIEIIKKQRAALLKLTEDLTIEQLNIVPAGFNNNIIWNLGHLVAAQQGICYRRAGVDILITENYYNTYGPGSKPERFITATELEEIKSLFTSTIDQFVADYDNKLFSNYTPWATRAGIDLTNIDEASQFVIFHEGLHFGVINAQRRVVLGL